MYRANIGTFAQIMKRNQMEDTKHIKISEYNYPLPDERIAKFPLAVRDQSKLMVYRHDGFWKCMDTQRDKMQLEQMWQEGNAHWKLWK